MEAHTTSNAKWGKAEELEAKPLVLGGEMMEKECVIIETVQETSGVSSEDTPGK